VEPWQLFLAWLAVQILQTIQIAIVGRKVTRTLMPPPFAQQQQPAYRLCSGCGQLRSHAEMRDGLCSGCSAPPPQQTTPARRRLR
jgi:uncharacterized paraquat-inducible protein A